MQLMDFQPGIHKNKIGNILWAKGSKGNFLYNNHTESNTLFK